MASAPPRVKLITINGLFRQYDHRIPLRLDERVTVLHGRNGVGKTITLSLVASLLRGEYSELARVPFRNLRIDFADGSFLNANRSPEHIDQLATDRQAKKRGKTKQQQGELSPAVRLEYKIEGRHDEVLIPAPSARGRQMAINFDSPLKLDMASVRYGFRDGMIHGIQAPAPEEEPKEVGELRKRLLVHFIEAQRLYSITPANGPAGDDGNSWVISAVTNIASEVAVRIRETDSTYRSTSTRLDDSLPARLFTPAKNGPKLSKKELAQRTEALEAERRRLHELGLLPDTTSFNPSSLNDTQRAMFVVYLKDNEEKLSVFKALADRAEILLGTLNRKFAPKRIQLDKARGYKVLSHDGRPLDLDLLSSGEQHELVLLHNLLFRVEPGALLLIDEPELSLHVTWQDEFLADLIRIAKVVGFDAVVATHSPYIVGSRRDLMERLGEPV